MSDSTRVDFYFDPLCPWCWRTALWLRDVARRKPIDITWKLFSLMVVNHPDDFNTDEQYQKWFVLGRVLVAARKHGGNEAIDPTYTSLAPFGQIENAGGTIAATTTSWLFPATGRASRPALLWSAMDAPVSSLPRLVVR